ncbi:hypothetical protein [Sediminibacter sp. Hel_I_10]|uniref:hypothetical protein n=1 Tax=Sediminibacter sp. Hel_I_10 TaxID=1392490 RepID=UPI00047C5C8D|nr:hypothetical protein [Sediminibacter sp. Hel_I_10]
MAEKIKLFEADIDTDGIVRKSVELKEEITKLKLEQQKLKATTGEASTEFIKSEAQLKKVSKEYRLNQKLVENLSESNGNLLSVEQRLTAALGKEVISINQANKSNRELKAIRNEVNAETAEGQKAINLINEKLNENTEFVRKNVSALEDQKINIGNYKQSVKEAIEESSLFPSVLTNIGQGFVSAAKSAAAFLLTPIGAVLGLIAGAFLLVQTAMAKSEEKTNSIKRAFSAFTGIASKLFGVLEPLADFLLDGIVKGLELAEVAIYKTIDTISSGLELLGFDEQAEQLRAFNSEVQQGAKDAKALADAEAQLVKEQRNSRKLQADFERDAEKLRQIRDNENLSIKERKEANEELGRVLQKQQEEELRIAKLSLQTISARIILEGESNALLDQRAESLGNIADIENRITGQLSEQLTERVALEREAADQAREASEKRIEKAEQELELLREQRRFNAESLEELKFFANEETKILQQKLETNIITQTEYNTEILKLDNDLIEAKKIANEKEFERILAFEEQKKVLQEEIDLRNIEDANEKAIAKAELDFEKQVLELENLQLNEEQKTELLALMETNRNGIINDIKQKALDQQLEAYKAFSQAEIDARRANAEESAAIASQLTSILTGLLGDSLGAKLAALAIDAAIQVGLVSSTSAASQATNLAQAAAALPPPFNSALIGIAVGQNTAIQASSSKAISKILTSSALKGLTAVAGKVKFQDGGAMDIGGNRHSSGGTKFYGEDGTAFEAEKGEKMFILNRQASAALGPTLSHINQAYGGVALSRPASYLAAGGQVLRSNKSGTSNIDISKLSEAMTNAVEAGAERGSRSGSRSGSASGTYSGIVDRQDNEAIAAGANF